MDKSVLRKALADSEEPTPGYLFRDIAQMTFVDQLTQDKLIQYLLTYLDPKQSVHVLAKALRVIKHLCEEGHADFQKQMQSKADLLRQFASYRGPNDPKYGDKLNEKVRNTARDAIEAAFSHRRESKAQVGSGFGSNTVVTEEKKGFTTGLTVAAGGGAPGNAHMAPMPTSNRWAEEMSKSGAAPGVVLPSGGFVADLKTGFQTGFGLWSENVRTNQQRILEDTAKGGSFQAVEVPLGGGGGFGGSFGSSAAAAGGGSEWKFTSDGAGSGGATTAKPERVLNPYQKEIERLCLMKSIPQRVELAQFTTAVMAISQETGLGVDELAAAMDEKLAQKNPWAHRLHVLAALEHLLKNGAPPEFKQYFVENPEDVQRNVHVVQTALKEKAQKVLKLLGVPERGTEDKAASQMTSAGGHGEMTWMAPTAPSSAAGELDFGGMNVRGGRIRSDSNAKPAGTTASAAPPPASAVASKTEDPTKLRKRAPMQVANFVDTPAPATSNGGGWGVQPATTSSTASTSAWGAPTATVGGWGSVENTAGSNSTWGAPAPAAASAFSSPTAVAPAAAKPVAGGASKAFADIDELFGAPPPSSAAPIVQPMQIVPPVPAVATPALNMGPSAPSAPTAQPIASSVVPATTPAPSSTSSIASLQLRMAELNQQMMQLMAGGGAGMDPIRMQQLMQKQQQLMLEMTMAQQQQQAAPPVRHHTESFNAFHEEIKRMVQ
mgnify:CR=1 FL=1